MHRQDNLIKKIIVIFLVYSIVLIFLGRHMTFLPTISFSGKNEEEVETANSINMEVIQKFLTSEKGTYSIYYKDLKSGEEIGIDENKVLTAASLNKVVIASLLYNRAGESEIDLEDKITIIDDDIQDYGTGSIRYQEMPRAYTIKQLAKLMMEESDNTAAHVLTVYLGEDKLQEYAQELGLEATLIADNTTSASDMGKILEKIYDREVTTEALTRELLDFMKDTLFEDRLARNFPPSIEVYHKAADAITMVHDVGIIDDGKNAFVLTVLTTDMVSEDHAKEKIGALAKFIYDERN